MVEMKDFYKYEIDGTNEIDDYVRMNTIINVMQQSVEQLREILSDLRPNGKSTVQVEQMEFSFGMVREFEISSSVSRKTTSR